MGQFYGMSIMSQKTVMFKKIKRRDCFKKKVVVNAKKYTLLFKNNFIVVRLLCTEQNSSTKS